MNWLERILGLKCETCQVLREQLEHERKASEAMIEAYINVTNPRPIIHTTGAGGNSQPAFKAQILPSRRRAELERVDRESMKLKKTSPVIGKSDAQIEQDKVIAKMEEELGVTGEVTEETGETNAHDSNVNG